MSPWERPITNDSWRIRTHSPSSEPSSRTQSSAKGGRCRGRYGWLSSPTGSARVGTRAGARGTAASARVGVRPCDGATAASWRVGT